jgi:hypothetical protein
MVSCCGCVAMAVALRLGRWEGRTRQGWEGRRKETELCFGCACAETVVAVTATCIGFRFRFILFASLLPGAAGTAGMGTLPAGRWGSVCLGCPGSQSSIGPSSRAYSAYWHLRASFSRSRFPRKQVRRVIVCQKRFHRPRAMLRAIWATVDQSPTITYFVDFY